MRDVTYMQNHCSNEWCICRSFTFVIEEGQTVWSHVGEILKGRPGCQQRIVPYRMLPDTGENVKEFVSLINIHEAMIWHLYGCKKSRKPSQAIHVSNSGSIDRHWMVDKALRTPPINPKSAFRPITGS